MPCAGLSHGPTTHKHRALRDRISVVNTDNITIIVAVLGVGLALWRAIATIRQDVDSRHKDLRQDLRGIRQDIKETNARIDSMEGRLNSRIDALYQALFSLKDPTA